MYKILFFAAFSFTQCMAADSASIAEINAVVKMCNTERALAAWGWGARFSTRNEENYLKIERQYKAWLNQKKSQMKSESELEQKLGVLKKHREDFYFLSTRKDKTRKADLAMIAMFLHDNGFIFDADALAKISTYKEAIKFISMVSATSQKNTTRTYEKDLFDRKHYENLTTAGWKKLTSPLEHRANNFRYIVHGIQEGSKGEAYFADYAYFAINEPLTLSVSVVDKKKKKLTTAISSGVILDVFKENIYACHDKNMARLGKSCAAMNEKFGIHDLDDILDQTSNKHNELTILSKVTRHDLDSAIGISAYFINLKSVSWHNPAISRTRLAMIKSACLENARPVILIE